MMAVALPMFHDQVNVHVLLQSGSQHTSKHGTENSHKVLASTLRKKYDAPKD